MTGLYAEHADLYDLAFDWDVGEEVAWLQGRLGPGCRSVLEPGCGSGRMLAAFAARGLEAVGIDRSAPMLALARARLETAGLDARLVLGDMADFDLGRPVDGAVCPINTLSHLAPAEVGRHLACVGRHLAPGARYLVQVAVRDAAAEPQPLWSSAWRAERDGVALDVRWATESVDLRAGRERHRSRIAIRGGPRDGELVEEVHEMTAWTVESWEATIAASPFWRTAVFDGGDDRRPEVAATAAGGLLWHALTRLPAAPGEPAAADG